VYDWEGGEWIQAGSTIEGLQANESIGSIATLSGDGNTIAAGVPGNTINTGTTGEVRTYVWDGSDWVAQGDFLEGNAIGERFGKSVSLSVNGTRLAVGSLSPETDGTKPGKVFVFQWDGMVWQPVGSPISGLTDGDDFGSSISINSNGKRLAVGSRENDLNGKGAGLIQVFDLIGGKWVQVGGNILGDNPEIEDETFDDDGLGGKIVLAANGTRVVGGSDGLGNLDGLILGYVTTYSLAPGSISCFAEDEVEIKTCEDCERVNYALGNPTSNSCDYGFAYSDLGVDGIIKGDNPWGTPDIVHTCVPPTTDPWWHVDLQREIFVTEVCLYNRNSQIEAILDRLSEYYIFVSPQPFDENASLEDLLADRTIYHTFVEERAAFPSCIEIPQVFGRYVRIQLPGTRILNFAELEVYGCKKSSCINPPNIALKKEARQSTTYGFGDASIAVDGDIDGTRGPWSDPSIQHTDREEQPWWQVDLGKPSTVKEVSIFNRTECCVQRLQDFYVFVSPRPIDGDLPVEELVANPDIAFEFVKGNAGPKETLTFSNEVGQYVMVKLSKIGILHMSEVEVIGCEGQTASSPSNRFAEAGEDLDAALTTGLTTLAYPNPFRENLTLEIGGELQAGAQLELINSLGQVVDRQAITGNTHQIEGRNLPQGMYFVQLQNGVDQHKIKVVKLQ
ncbi:MAG: discoidin domain-containing protein, partial [Bacteroidota bacterium]